jgi:hypothetical protein
VGAARRVVRTAHLAVNVRAPAQTGCGRDISWDVPAGQGARCPGRTRQGNHGKAASRIGPGVAVQQDYRQAGEDPLEFKYAYTCSEKGCPTHTQGIIDWELGALYLKLRNASATEGQIKAKIRAKFLNDLCGPERDPIFIAGNLVKYPTSFMILGVVYPKRGPVQKSLF